MTKKVVKTEPIESAITNYNMPDVTMKAIAEFRKAEKLECKDAKSRQIIGKHRSDIKSIISQVETKRKDNNRDYQSKNNGHAVLLKDILTLSRDVFDTKIKAYDSIAAEKKEEKDRIKAEETAKIKTLMDDITDKCAAGLELSKDSKSITESLEALQAVEISAIDFGDMTEDAEKLLADGIVNTGKALAKRIIYEDEQARQEKEAKKLREEQAAFKKKQLAERERQMEEDKERERKQQIQDHIDRLQKEVAMSVNSTSSEFKSKINFLEDYPIKKDWFQERFEEAEKIVSDSLDSIKPYLESALKAEKQAKKLKSDREAMEKEKKDLASKKLAEINRKEAVKTLFEEMFYSSDPEDDRKTYVELKERFELADESILKGSISQYKIDLMEELGTMRDQSFEYASDENDLFNYHLEWAKQIDIRLAKEKLKSDKKRSKLINADVVVLKTELEYLKEYTDSWSWPEFKTIECTNILEEYTTMINRAGVFLTSEIKNLSQ